MKTNILIFPAGETNSIELHDALSHNVNINVFGASSIDRHGPYVFKNYRGGLPFINAKNFIQEFNKLLFEWKIDFVFPTHDSVALFLAEKQKDINAKIMAADFQTALICRDKKETYKLFYDCDFCPKQFDSFIEFPVFIKPREGQGAIGTRLIETIDNVPDDIHLDDYIISEYLPGEELTVDCLTDSKGKLCACLPRIRHRVMAGVSVAGETIEVSEEVLSIGRKINSRLNFLGLWYFQLKKDINDKYKLLEISTRCAGTMCLSRARGINLPLLSIYVSLGYQLNIFENPYNITMDRALISRYKINYEYDTVYIDYDDTVVEKDKVCIPVIRYIYQCKNQNKKMILITRHEEDHNDSIEDSMKKHHIDISIFDEIIKLSFKQKKSSVINPNRAIFIDNAYAERKDIHDQFNIPVFDVEGIEVLLDWRE